METAFDQQPTISFEDFLKVDIRIGTIIEAKANSKAIKPAFTLKIDFGDLGVKQSSAQITENYSEDALLVHQLQPLFTKQSGRYPSENLPHAQVL